MTTQGFASTGDLDADLLDRLRRLGFDGDVVGIRFNTDEWDSGWYFSCDAILILGGGKEMPTCSSTLGRTIDEALDRYGATSEGRWIGVNLHTGDVQHGGPDDEPMEFDDRLAGLCSCGAIVTTTIAERPQWTHLDYPMGFDGDEDAWNLPHTIAAVAGTVAHSAVWDCYDAKSRIYPHPYTPGGVR